MTTTIPLAVTARDEARSIGACLDSLAVAIAIAEARCAIRIARLVVVDDSRDATAAIALARNWPIARSTGGKVEAQRAAQRPGPFQIFADADIAVAPDTLAELCAAMLADPARVVAVPPKYPRPPRRAWSPLARALHVYNARRGFSAQRTWFSGKLFAIRGWAIPDARAIAARAAALPPRPFVALAAPLRVDDIYLSRAIVHARGPGALHETAAGALWFRAPETLRGMYRYYRRMRRELERVDALFPELAPAARAYGTRRAEHAAEAPLGDRAARAVFDVALAACRAAYRVERFAVDRLGVPAGDPWPAIAETK